MTRTLWRSLIAAILAVTALCSARVPAGATSASNWQVLSQGGRFWPTLFHPAGLAVGGRGNIFVADAGNARLVRLDTSGGQSLAFGTAGSGLGQFGLDAQGLGPDSVAVDRQGNLYIADTGHSMVDKFAPGGVYLESWPIQGADYAVKHLAITMGPNDTLYLAIAAAILCSGTTCPTYYIVQRRSLSGMLLGQWRSGAPPPAPNPNAEPDFDVIAHISIAVGGKGTVYVATTGILICYKSCPDWWSLDKRSPNGKLVKSWGGPGVGLQVWPTGLAVDRAGNLYIADELGHAIVRLTPDGRRSVRWSHFGWGTGTGRYAIPEGVALDAHGNVYVSDLLAHGIVKLSPGGKQLAYWGARGSTPGRFASPQAVALDAAGNIYVNDTGNARIQKLAPSGKVLLHFPVPNIGPAIAVDPAGSIYVSQMVNKHIVIDHFSPAGKLLTRWTPAALVEEQPSGLTLGPEGILYVGGYMRFPSASGSTLPQYATGLLVLDRNGKQRSLTQIGRGYLLSGLALDATGNIYLVNVLAQKGMKLSPTGAVLTTWTLAKSDLAAYVYIAGIALDAAGNIYITDGSMTTSTRDTVREFSPAGKLIEQWGGSGVAPGQFHGPEGIAVGPKGTVYVADRDNDRIQRMTPAG